MRNEDKRKNTKRGATANRITASSAQTRIYDALNNNSSSSASSNTRAKKQREKSDAFRENNLGGFLGKRVRSVENALGTTLSAPAALATDAGENIATAQLLGKNKSRMDDVAKKYGYNSYQDVWDARDKAESEGDKTTLDMIDNVINPELQSTASSNAAKANKKASDYADYADNSYFSQKINQDRGKFAGSAINTLSTGFDIMAPAAGAVANSVQGGIEGIADELEESGLEDFNAERALQNAAIGATTGAVVGKMNSGMSNALAKRGGNLFKGNNALTRGLNNLGSNTAAGRVGSTIATGAGRGAISGAVGGATGGGLSALTNGQDVLQGVLQGATQGAREGALLGGAMSGANMALGKTKPMQKINEAAQDWTNSGRNFDERLTNTLTSGKSPAGNSFVDWVQGRRQSKLLNTAGSLGNSIRDYTDQGVGPRKAEAEAYKGTKKVGNEGEVSNLGRNKGVDLDRLRDVAESNGWTMTDLGDGTLEFEGYSPAGENLLFRVPKDDPIRGLENEFRDFDQAEHVDMWEGGNGAPSRERLVEDAKDIDQMLYTLYQEANDANTAPTTAKDWLKQAGSRALDDLNGKGVGLSTKQVGNQNNATSNYGRLNDDDLFLREATSSWGPGNYRNPEEFHRLHGDINDFDNMSFRNETTGEVVSGYDLRKAGVLSELYSNSDFRNFGMGRRNSLGGANSQSEFDLYIEGDSADNLRGVVDEWTDWKATGDWNDIRPEPSSTTPTTVKDWLKKAGNRALDDLNNKGVGLSTKQVNDYPEDVRNMKVNNNMAEAGGEDVQSRLDYLKGEIEKGNISYGELAELQGYKQQILDSGDTELAEWAGIPEEEFMSYQDRNSKPTTSAVDNSPETLVARTLQPQQQSNINDLMYGESQLGNRTKRGMTADALERFGNTLEGAQSNITRAAAKDLGIESVGKVIENVRKKTGITNLETQGKLAKELTGGADSLMDNIQRQALTASDDGKGFKVDTTPVLDKVDSIVDKYADTNTFGSQNNRSKFISNLKQDISSFEGDVLSTSNRMKAIAADLQGRGVVDPKPIDAAKAKIYMDIASELDDLSYNAIPKENVDAMFDATISEMRGRANQAAQNGNKDIERAYNTLADKLNAEPRTIKAYRSFKKDFVDASKVATLSARAENGAAVQMGRGFGAGLKQFAGTIAQRPVNALLAKAGGAVNEVANRIDGGDGTPRNPSARTTAPEANIEPAQYDPRTQLYNALGRTEGSLQGEEQRNAEKKQNTIDAINAAQMNKDANLESFLTQVEPYARPNTALYNTMYNANGAGVPTTSSTSSGATYIPETGDYWTDVIGRALNQSIEDNDVALFAELYNMYQDSLANLQKNSGSTSATQNKLTDTQRRAYAAENSLGELEAIVNGNDNGTKVAYAMRDVPILGGITNIGGNSYDQAANSLATQIGYMMSGANIKEEEARRIGQSYVPQPFDNDAVKLQKLQRARQIIEQYKNTYGDTTDTDYSSQYGA